MIVEWFSIIEIDKQQTQSKTEKNWIAKERMRRETELKNASVDKGLDARIPSWVKALWVGYGDRFLFSSHFNSSPTSGALYHLQLKGNKKRDPVWGEIEIKDRRKRDGSRVLVDIL